MARRILKVTPAPPAGAAAEDVGLQSRLDQFLHSDDPWIRAIAERATTPAPHTAAPAPKDDDERPTTRGRR